MYSRHFNKKVYGLWLWTILGAILGLTSVAGLFFDVLPVMMCFWFLAIGACITICVSCLYFPVKGKGPLMTMRQFDKQAHKDLVEELLAVKNDDVFSVDALLEQLLEKQIAMHTQIRDLKSQSKQTEAKSPVSRDVQLGGGEDSGSSWEIDHKRVFENEMSVREFYYVQSYSAFFLKISEGKSIYIGTEQRSQIPEGLQFDVKDSKVTAQRVNPDALARLLAAK